MKHLLFFSIYSLSFSTATVSFLDSPWTITHDDSPFQPSQFPHHIPSRAKRYVLRRKRWKANRMTWRLLRNHITEADVYIIRNTLHRAFNDWSAISNVQFDEVHQGESDLKISFERGFHEDRYAFDGRDGIVAHAFYPRDGRLHFDADEEWTLNQSNGVNLYQTALHEIGHLIGLEHSNDPRAAMFASKRPYSPVFTLSDDDVRAARELFPYREMSSSTSLPLSTTTVESSTTPIHIESSTTQQPVTHSEIHASTSTLSSTASIVTVPTLETTTEMAEKESESTMEVNKTEETSASHSTTTTISPMNRRPVFRLSPVFSSANRRLNLQSVQKPRLGAKKERIRSYSMLTLMDETTDMKKTSFFAQQAQMSSLQSFKL
ncbi:zmp-6 [Pristionchus pacificus]|nr:zmp-6 [Pristionchus pacificus]